MQSNSRRERRATAKEKPNTKPGIFKPGVLDSLDQLMKAPTLIQHFYALCSTNTLMSSDFVNEVYSKHPEYFNNSQKLTDPPKPRPFKLPFETI